MAEARRAHCTHHAGSLFASHLAEGRAAIGRVEAESDGCEKVRMVICTRVQSASGLLECQRITAIYRVEGRGVRRCAFSPPGTRASRGDVVVLGGA